VVFDRYSGLVEQGSYDMKAWAVWIHFAVLLLAAVAVQVLRPAGLGALAGALYGWVPLLVGVAVAIMPTGRASVRRGLKVAAFAGLLMLVLDLAGAYQEGPKATAEAVVGEELRAMGVYTGVGNASWVQTAVRWRRGELVGAQTSGPPYPPGHPRVVAVVALTEFGLLLLCLATTGAVLGVSSWYGRHTRFDSRANETGARIATAWLVSGGIVFMALELLGKQRFRVLFEDSTLPTLLLPFLPFLALGLLGFVAAARVPAHDAIER